MAQSTSLPHRALRGALAALLAVGMLPTAAFAVPGENLAEPSDEIAPANEASNLKAVEGQALVLYRADTSASSRSSQEADADTLRANGFSVAQEWDLSTVDTAVNQGIVPRAAEEDAENTVPSGENLRIALVEREGARAEELVNELETLDFVEAAQPNYLISTDSAAVNDTLYDAWQYSLTSESAGIDLEAALAALKNAPLGEKNIVAVIDTGVDGSNPDLEGVMWRNPGIDGLPGNPGSHGYDFAENDDDPSPSAVKPNSHGTHCAGIIAGAVNNDEGIAGASSDTEIMALKATADEGDGIMYLNSIVSAYEYVIGAALAGENVVAINDSWAISSYLPVLDYVVNQAGKMGILSLFAAGNDGSDTAELASAGATAGLQSPYAVIVASSNQANALSSFSNYNETEVDVALPGSNIMATVSTKAAREYFAPSVSLAAGKELVYANDFSDFGKEPERYTVTVQNSDGTPASDEVAAAFTLEAVEDAGHGQPGLKVTFDPTGLDAAKRYRVVIEWEIDNPFLGSAYAAEDYALGVTGSLGENTATDVLAQFGARLSAVRGEELLPLHASGVGSIALSDNFQINATSLSAIDTESPKLRAGLLVAFATTQSASPDEKAVAYVEPYGVGLVSGDSATEAASDYAPYAFMSGTSMATPLASGTVAQMAALDEDASALELRGRFVGSTVPVETTYGGVEKHTATDGRFDWNVALDENAVSANTWAVDADLSTRTLVVHGYGLSDASVTFDGAPATVKEQTNDRLAITVPADAFNGGAHRIDVTDTSTGRTHRASYQLPLQDASYDLAFASELPCSSEEAGNGALVSAEGTLYLADKNGRYLYRTAYPTSEAWSRCAAAGMPQYGTDSTARTQIAYAADGNDLCAFATGKDENGTLAVYASVYQAETDRWSSYERVATIESSLSTYAYAGASVNAGTVDGTACAVVNGMFQDENEEVSSTYLLVKRDHNTASFAVEKLESAELDDASLASSTIIPHDGKATVFGIVEAPVEDGESAIALQAFDIDLANGTVTDRGAFEGASLYDKQSAPSLLHTAIVPFGHGALMLSREQEQAGDTLYLNLQDMSCEHAIWIGANSSSGMVVASGATYEGTVYLNAIEANSSSTSQTGALWTLPYSAAEQLAGNVCPTADYHDLDHAAWYHGAVDWAVSSHVMTGIDAEAGLFAPASVLTRAQMAQVLYNMAGAPAVEGAVPYADCPADAWYADAVTWTAQQGMFQGYGDTGMFVPDDALTRDQIAQVMWRLAGNPETGSDLSRFEDASSVSKWAQDAVEWAVAEGYLRGIGGTTELQPQGGLERAQAATVLMRADRDGFPFPQPTD